MLLAGAGDPREVTVARKVPIWAFHGANDKVIPLERMEELMAALRSAHANPMYTIIPKGDHSSAWGKGLKDPTLLPWMFAQRRGRPHVPFEKVAGTSARRPTSLEK